MQEKSIKAAAKRYPHAIMDPFDALLDTEGIDAIFTLCKVLGGATVYIPSARRVFEGCIALAIHEEFTGYNHKSLAQKYGCSESHIRRVISRA